MLLVSTPEETTRVPKVNALAEAFARVDALLASTRTLYEDVRTAVPWPPLDDYVALLAEAE